MLIVFPYTTPDRCWSLEALSSRQKHLLPAFKTSCTTLWLCFLDRLAKQGWDIGSWGFSQYLEKVTNIRQGKRNTTTNKKIKNTNTDKSLIQEVTDREGEKSHPPSKLCTATPNLLLPPAVRWLTRVTETQPYLVFRTVLLLDGDYPIHATILHRASIDCNLNFIQNLFDICTYTDGSD